MSRRRRSQEYEPISDLFGDVVRDGPSFLYGEAPSSPAADEAARPAPAPVAPGDIRRSRAAAAAAAASAARDAAPDYVDDRGLLSAVVLLHGAVAALTLGLYRFWLKTQQRRVIWSHTRLEGEPLEYAGRGGDLFVGAMIGLIVVVVLLVVANLSAVLLSFASVDLRGAALGGAAGAALLLPLVPLAAFRARRYRLSRTRWRGIRFGMEGSGVGMVGLALAWAPAVVGSAGLLWPLWRWARERRMTRAMRWGDQPFLFGGSGWKLLPHWLPLWSLGAGAAAVAASPELRVAAGLDQPGRLLDHGWTVAIAAAALAAIGPWLLWCNYRAAEVRLFWRARSLAGVRAACSFSLWHLVDAQVAVLRRNIWPGILVYLLIGLVTAIPLFTAVQVELEGPRPSTAAGWTEAVFGGLSNRRAQGLLLMAIAIDLVLTTVFATWLWMAVHARAVHEHLCGSLRFQGVHKLDAVRQRMGDRDLEAEGLAEALDAAVA